MNTERMLELAEFLEKLPEKQFDMEIWVNDLTRKFSPYFQDEYDYKNCNTVCCIAGWTVGLFNETGFVKPNNKRDYTEETIVQEATRLLDLTRGQAVNLFYTNGDTYWEQYEDELSLEHDDEYNYSINNRQAAYVLKDIVAGNLLDFNYDSAVVEDEDWEVR
jgi:hypothetical protein